MKNILHIRSSSNLETSISRRMGDIVLDLLDKQCPNAQKTVLDLARNPLPHISPEQVQGRMQGQYDTAAFKPLVQAINQLKGADIIVIEAPMYNFNIPSSLKAWIDYVCQPRETFAYSEKGPEGLVKNKKVMVILSRGGAYSDGAMVAMDHQKPYLKTVLGFIGMTEIDFLTIEGIAFGAEHIEKSITENTAKAKEIIANLP
jgi:FMN-dependent NADH-azoreductase